MRPSGGSIEIIHWENQMLHLTRDVARAFRALARKCVNGHPGVRPPLWPSGARPGPSRS